jgi:uncharacterized protein (TIGR03083 family)
VTPAPLDHTDLLTAITTETARLSAALGVAGLDAPVPTVPGWHTARLARHVGDAQRWAEAVVRTRATEFVAVTGLDDRTPPDDADGVAQWLVSGAQRLVAALTDAGPDTQVWSWAEQPSSGFWARWAVHETLLRRVDAELAAGLPVVVDPALAVDGVGHWLDVLALTDDGAHPLRGTGETVHLHATDHDGEWTLTRTPDGLRWEPGHARGDAALRAPAADLLRVLTRRRTLGGLDVLGDRAVLDDLLADTDF